MRLRRLALFCAFACASVIVALIVTRHKAVKIKIGAHAFKAEVASTMAQRAKGLSGRKSIGPGEAMLFRFDRYANHEFWMAGMEMPIDILCIRDYQVVGFTKNIEADSKELFNAPEPVNRAVEVAAGTVDTEGIGIGDAFYENNF